MAQSQAADAASAEAKQRVTVERRHRRQWAAQRKALAAAISATDGEKLKFIKLVAETLKLCQEGERKAWRLDKPVEARDAGATDGAGHGAALTRIECVVIDPQNRDA